MTYCQDPSFDVERRYQRLTTPLWEQKIVDSIAEDMLKNGVGTVLQELAPTLDEKLTAIANVQMKRGMTINAVKIRDFALTESYAYVTFQFSGRDKLQEGMTSIIGTQASISPQEICKRLLGNSAGQLLLGLQKPQVATD